MDFALHAGVMALTAWVVCAARIGGTRVPSLLYRRIYNGGSGAARRP
jgi:hypothetical protein